MDRSRLLQEKFPYPVRVDHFGARQLRDSLEWATETFGPTHFPTGQGAQWLLHDGAFRFRENEQAALFRAWAGKQMGLH